MPSKLRIRYIFRPLVKGIAKGLSKIGVTPNIATILMLLLAVSSFIALFYLSNLLLFAVLIFCTGIFDGVDGAIAKLTKTSTKQGGFLDSTLDRFSEAVIFLALFIFCIDQSLWDFIDMRFIIICALFFSIMISYTRTRAQNLEKGDYDIGLMGRSERLFFLFIACLVAFFIGFLNEFLFAYVWLVLGTFTFRFLKIKSYIENKETQKKQKIS